MSEALGLSVGVTNLVAARVGAQPVTDESPDGGEGPLTAALEAIARTADDGAPATAVIAVPAHWGPAAVGALRGALRSSPLLSPTGVAPTIVSDATAALAALAVGPGLPGGGVVALCDFGGSGTSISLADAGAGLTPIGETVRVTDFSGDRIDQAVLDHVLAGIRAAGHDDPSATTEPGGLNRLREECRQAKERLSSETTSVIPVDLPGYRSEVGVTRTELENAITEPFAIFLDALADVLERNQIPVANLAAIATVGGGAAIPMITQRLSEQLRVPVVTMPLPGLAAATGAAVIAQRSTATDAPTGIAVTAADAPTSMAPTAWASSGQAATESAADGSPSATSRALAWSQDDPSGADPVPYTGADYVASPPTGERPTTDFEPAYPGDDRDTVLVDAGVLPWYRRPSLLWQSAGLPSR